MDSRSIFRPRLQNVDLLGDRGTKSRRLCGLAVQPRRGNPRRECEIRRLYQSIKRLGVDTREKPSKENCRRPYRKPTQVGEASSLR
jgi:hypothetical protein